MDRVPGVRRTGYINQKRKMKGGNMETDHETKIRCPRCGISVPDVPEGATYDEMLCCRCYDELEMEAGREA